MAVMKILVNMICLVMMKVKRIPKTGLVLILQLCSHLIIFSNHGRERQSRSRSSSEERHHHRHRSRSPRKRHRSRSPR